MQCYHKPCDNLETLLTNDNINFLGKTADVTVMTIHKLSEPTSGKLWRYTNLELMLNVNILEYFRMIIQLLPSYEVNIKLSMLEKKTATLGLTTVDVHLMRRQWLYID
jgi:hypothetical protein